MRIAVWHNLPSGGGKRALQQQVLGLLEAGHEVRAWAPEDRDPFLPLTDSGIAEDLVPLRPVATVWRRRPTAAVIRATDAIAAMDEHLRECGRRIDAWQPDVVLVHPCREFRAVWLAEHLRSPAVLYLQEPLRRLYEAAPMLPWTKDLPAVRGPRTAARWAYAVASLAADRRLARREQRSVLAYREVLVNSAFSRESVLRTYGRDATVCYLSVDVDTFRRRTTAARDHVLSLGAFTPAKSTETVIRAVAGLRAPRPPLVWVGNIASSRHLVEMRDLALSLGVDLSVEIGLDDDAVLDRLHRASVMVFAARLEPFGLAPLEAAACGVPVVAVREGGVRESFVDGVTGLLVDLPVEAVTRAVQSVLDDAGSAERLGTAAADDVRQRFSRAAATDRLVTALRRNAGQPVRP